MNSSSSTDLLEQQSKRCTFHGLDALRGVAAAVVVSRHAPAWFGVGLFPGSSLGVDLFFVLSGFVIAHAYDGRIESGMSAAKFMLIRLIRLFPLYLLGTLIGAAAAAATLATGITSAQTGMAWNAADLAKSSILSIFLLPTPPQPEGMESLYPLDAVAWSLAFEIFINAFYVVFHKFLTTKVLLVTMAISGVLLCWSAFAFMSVDLGWNWSTILPGLTRVFYSFPAGLLLYRLWGQPNGEKTFSLIWPIAITILTFKINLAPTAEIAFSLAAIIVLFPLITLLASRAAIPAVLVKPCAFLGLTSYALYALHRPLLSVINGTMQIMHVHLTSFVPATGVLLVAMLLVIAWVVDICYDQPVRSWLTRMSSQRPSGAPKADPSALDLRGQ